ncbi:hypothetical protein [Prosthecobacter fluviatilis]|uniref:VWFA domain-containing protein n=1 Tax=Prosthecobacter fluviatilis TaxID=445931 RepID=A0ABW0KNH3_9BACT
MSRHVFDDFSFLPTVDSTDGEVMENELPKSTPEVSQQEWTEPLHEEAASQASADEAVHQEVTNEEQSLEAAPPPPSEQPFFLQTPEISPAAELGAVQSFSEVEQGVQGREIGPELPSTRLLPLEHKEDQTGRDRPEAVPTPRLPQAASEARTKVEKQPADHAPPEDVTAKGDDAKPAQNPKPFIAPKPPPEEPLDPDQEKKLRWQKLADKIGLRTLGMSFGVHMFLLLIAAFIGVSQVMDPQVDFLPGGSSPHSQAAAAELTHKIQNKKNPWLKARPVQRKITVQTLSSNIVMPEMAPMEVLDFDKINNRMDLSKAPASGLSQPMGLGGAGGGLGAGIGRGGKFSFVGQTAVGRRVIFVVDVSGSMSQPLKGDGPRMTRFELLKKELIKAVRQIPFGTAYQVLYFSDFAWPHNEVSSQNGEAFAKYTWNIRPDDYKEVKIPTFKYIQASPFTIQESVDLIQKADNPGLTNWGSGLLMALNANPKPDVIFFMTDGERQDENGWIDIVTAVNKSKLPMTVIHTSVMAQVDAAREMDALAKRNNGSFSVVAGEGKVIKGEEFFKMK